MSATNNNSLFLLTWRIPKPPENSWKSNESFGGGIFHFYCIHFIKFALDLEVKIEDINIDSRENYLYFFFTSKGNSYSLKLFLTDNSPNFLVTVKLDQKETIIYENSTPFGSGTNRLLKDPRVPYLRKYLHSRIDNSTTICKDLEIEEAAIYLIKKYYNH